MKTFRGHTPFRGEQLNIKGKSDLKEVLDVGLVSCLKLDSSAIRPTLPSGFQSLIHLMNKFSYLSKRLVAGPTLDNW